MTKKQAKRIFRIFLFGGTAISLFYVPWILVWAWILPLPNTVQEQVEESIGHGFDGMIVYVDQGGKPPAWYTAGWHDREAKIPAKPDALFKLAGINKLYLAVATAKLVKANQLDLDQSLAGYFPELADRIEYADRITLRMMVQHRSGIPNFTDHPDFWNNPPQSAEGVLALALDKPAYFEPDTDYGYCNTNYLLIANLIDKTVGSHQQYIQATILDRLGVTNTYFSLDDVDMDQLMSGYYVGVEEDLKTNHTGSMLATAEDVGIFLRGLNDGSVFDEGEQDIYSSIYVYEHGGLMPGYQSLAEYHPDIDAVVIQFMNTTNFTGYNWNLGQIVYNRVVDIVEENSDR